MSRETHVRRKFQCRGQSQFHGAIAGERKTKKCFVYEWQCFKSPQIFKPGEIAYLHIIELNEKKLCPKKVIEKANRDKGQIDNKWDYRAQEFRMSRAILVVWCNGWRKLNQETLCMIHFFIRLHISKMRELLSIDLHITLLLFSRSYCQSQ